MDEHFGIGMRLVGTMYAVLDNGKVIEMRQLYDGQFETVKRFTGTVVGTRMVSPGFEATPVEVKLARPEKVKRGTLTVANQPVVMRGPA